MTASCSLALLFLTTALAACGTTSAPRASEPLDRGPSPPTTTAALARFEQPVPACTSSLTFVLVPASKPFWISTTEVPWQCFDAWVYKKDELAGATNGNVDAITRPTQPYNPMDRGFGHADYPALSMSFQNAQSFCAWLAAHTGRPYRLPSEAEWEFAARAGQAGARPSRAASEFAWSARSSPNKTQPIGKLAANGYGLFDVLGNAAEWCVAPDGTGVVRGGSYQTPESELAFGLRAPETPAWNLRDPQIPKSKWWLIDAGFVGLRVVCDEPASLPER